MESSKPSNTMIERLIKDLWQYVPARYSRGADVQEFYFLSTKGNNHDHPHQPSTGEVK